MRQSTKMASIGVIVSLLLLSTTSVMAGSSSNSNQKQNSGNLLKVPKSVDPILKMEKAGEILRKKRARERALRRKRERNALIAQANANAPTGITALRHLEAIGECESDSPTDVSRNSLFYGKYQFMDDTWESVGGIGHASGAPEAEQDYRALLLYARSGPGQWPECQKAR